MAGTEMAGTEEERPARGREERGAVLAAVGAGLAGAAGLLPGARGASDPLAVLAWLALAALPLGALVGGTARLRWPVRLVAPALWAFVVLEAELLATPPATPLPAASLGLGVASGLWLAGLALGRWWGARAAAPLALAVLCVALAPARASVGGGPGTGRAPSAVERGLLEVSPLVVGLESAGHDWTHAQPDVYAHSGVEVVPRRATRGILAAPVLLLVGWTLAHVAHRKRAPWPCASTSAPSPSS